MSWKMAWIIQGASNVIPGVLTKRRWREVRTEERETVRPRGGGESERPRDESGLAGSLQKLEEARISSLLQTL